jgi:hypothetical protein
VKALIFITVTALHTRFIERSIAVSQSRVATRQMIHLLSSSDKPVIGSPVCLIRSLLAELRDIITAYTAFHGKNAELQIAQEVNNQVMVGVQEPKKDFRMVRQLASRIFYT